MVRNGVGGDGDVQDAIVRSLNSQLAEYKRTQRNVVLKRLRYEIRKREVLDDHYETLARTRRSIAAQTRRSLRDLERLTESRANLAMNCALSDILEELDELQRDLTFDRATTIDTFDRLNEGLFFKNLYDGNPPRFPEHNNYAAVSYIVILLAIACCVWNKM